MVTAAASGAADPDGPQTASLRFRLASAGTATALGALAVVMAGLALVLSALTHQLSVLGSGPIIPVVLVYAAVGVLVARRQPGNPIGWILILFIVIFLASDIVGAYAALDYKFGHHGLPLAAVAVVLQPSWAPALLLFPVAILVFPDGRLSRRWRRVLAVYVVAGALASAAIYSPAVQAVARHDVRLDDFGDVTGSGHPAGGLLAAMEVLGFGVILVLWLSFVGHQVASRRRASGERRQQLKWLASGGTVSLVVIAGSFGIKSTSVSGEILGIGLAALPAGIGVGILKYRLYDIDRIISRTLAYAVVTGLLVGVYAGLVLLATGVLGLHSTVAVAAATLIAAALFTPLRRRVQHAVDRRFNRARYDADAAVAAFADQLKETVDPDSVQAELAGVVQRTLEPAHLTVWLSRSAD
jgi:hypothetical protein